MAIASVPSPGIVPSRGSSSGSQPVATNQNLGLGDGFETLQQSPTTLVSRPFGQETNGTTAAASGSSADADGGVDVPMDDPRIVRAIKNNTEHGDGKLEALLKDTPVMRKLIASLDLLSV